MLKLLKDRYFWSVVSLIGIAAILAYPLNDYILNKLPSEMERHDIELLLVVVQNGLLMIAVLIASWQFMFRGGLVAVLTIALVLLPHIITDTIADFRLGHLSVYIIGTITGVVISWFVGYHKQSKEKVELSAKEWERTFDSITDLISIHSRDHHILRANKAFASALNMKKDEVIGRSCCDLFHGTDRPPAFCPHDKTLENKTVNMVEEFEPFLGIWVQIYTSPVINEKGDVIATVHIARDISERKRLLEQLMTQDRLASVGQLVAGIAHEIKNPLTSVIGFSDLLLINKDCKNFAEDLKIINDEAKRTVQIANNLLTFARKQPEGKAEIQINEQIERVIALRAHEQKGNNIRVISHLAADLPVIMANSSQMQQVFFNLVVNAEYAMLGAHNKGALTITTKQAGDIVRVSIADDGSGISPENMRKLFTPFFTTKPAGKGTGLGLSICYGIVTEHGGKLYAESELGKGTTFIIELPVSQRQ